MYQGTLAAGLILALSSGMALAEGDAAKGEKVFRKCQACHMVGEGAENRVGPVLTGIVGREIASVEDFDYSDALKELAAADGTWTPEELAAFLEKPRDFAKGTKMSFPGLRKEDERADVIAYLASFGGES
ncbi:MULTISPECIES: cytochrome c family protein [unclassified Salipiger]|uniref:c-type cytochrome n=1 Tax=unclassified Salipiger TaxID=2640570 RepID=UPI0013B98C85|nr:MULTISPECIES: cytochrome c family protein [unclassified Salipiger]NDV52711.1 cytochrome c family protein [Salipiger sp. PrR003]NDW34289.1 cytochrome c family protein [Salipiger sp. PrR007]